jgi:ATP synthase protein I
MAIDPARARRLAIGVAAGQGAVTLAGTVVCWLVGDSRTALSAALGGGISAVASLAMALLSFRGRTALDPQRALLAFFVGEAVKVGLVIVLFVVVLKTIKVVPLAMLGTYIATFFVIWVALARAMPSAGRIKRGD